MATDKATFAEMELGGATARTQGNPLRGHVTDVTTALLPVAHARIQGNPLRGHAIASRSGISSVVFQMLQFVKEVVVFRQRHERD
jgi:hypothetical protein